ncbi:MAG: sodium/proline symporter [Alphaproteobacteria bacterium]
MLISFLIFFCLFTGIGVASSFWKKSTIEDYFLASREIPAWLVALSFGATISSGATFIGFAGLAYKAGMAAVYAVAALTIGDHIGWLIARNKIRRKAHETQAHTYPSLIGKLVGNARPIVTVIAAIMTILCLGTYCSAQLVAGAKVGESLFGWDYTYFIVLGAFVLLAYCWSGGIRASIWTDAVQAILILISLLILIVAGLRDIGGLSVMWEQLTEIDPKLTDLSPSHLNTVLISWVVFGIAILGQPQLMVRHMVARSDQDLKVARRIYLSWRWVVLLMACLSGMIARVLIPTAESFDPELSIPLLWQDLLPPVLVGLLIAGLFSATMSTADSLLLSASSSLTQHLIPKWRDSYLFARLGTVLVIILIVSIALVATKDVLALVVLAWGWLGATLVPLIIVQLFGANPSQHLALIMMFSGFLTAIAWRYGFAPLNILPLREYLEWKNLMDLVPGVTVGFISFALLYPLERKNRISPENTP